MECNKFVDEKIGETDSPAFREHRAGCAGCARDLEELREVRSLYHAASAETYRRGIPSVNRAPRTAWIPMAAAAAVLVAVLVLILKGPGAGSAPKKVSETESTSTAFVRVHLEPWATDVRIHNALEDCWSKLEMLEGKR